jgi:GT2 family glycosyltransferase
MTKAVTIIVPVYGDWSSLKDCIESLKQFVGKQHTVMLVNDCGPETELMEKNIKQAIKDEKNFAYYRNPENLGFVETCNRAVFELDKTNNDILLLNSDTKVTKGFLEEMLVVLYDSPKIGVVSPRSNNATIATVPLSAQSRHGINPKKSYSLFLKLQKKMPRYSIIPTALGFCMLTRRDLIKKYGLFDTVFGKGYGEDADFGMRLKQHGFLSALCNRAYVYHLEARSFTLETKRKIMENSVKIINERYPGFSAILIKDYIRQALISEEGIYPIPQQVAGKHIKLKEAAKTLLRRNHSIYSLSRKAYTRLFRNST